MNRGEQHDDARALSADEQRLAELGYKQELKRGWSGFSNFAISFSIISVLAGCFTTYGQALEQRRPGRDLDRLAGDQRASILLRRPSRCPSSPRKYPTAGGIYYWAYEARRARLGLVHRLVQPARPGRDASPRSTTPLRRSCSTVLGLYNLNFIFNFAIDERHYERCTHVFVLFLLILIDPRADQRLLSAPGLAVQPASRSGGTSIGVAVIVVILIFGAQPSRQSVSFVFGHRRNNAGFRRHQACTGSTSCRSASC